MKKEKIYHDSDKLSKIMPNRNYEIFDDVKIGILCTIFTNIM